MAQIALSSHGTILKRNGTPIGELGDISGPGLMRNEFDATSHNRDIDTWVMGVLRRDPITFPVFYNKTDATHGISAGLLKAISDASFDGYTLEFTDGSIWLASGFCRTLSTTMPVDGLMSANVTVRLSGAMYIDGTLFGGAGRVRAAFGSQQQQTRETAMDTNRDLSADDIANATDTKPVPFEVPEWKAKDGQAGVIYLQPLSAEAAMDYADAVSGANSKQAKTRKESMARILVLSITNAEGVQLFTDDAVAMLMKRSIRACNRIQAEVIRLNGMGDDAEAVGAAKKD